MPQVRGALLRKEIWADHAYICIVPTQAASLSNSASAGLTVYLLTTDGCTFIKVPNSTLFPDQQARSMIGSEQSLHIPDLWSPPQIMEFRVPDKEIILRWIATDQISHHQRRALDALLSPGERARAARFRLDKDRLTFTAAHALARSILTELTGRAPLTWRFDRGRYGKPEPITCYGEPVIHLNLSHTDGLAVVAASIGRDLGVDAEWLGRPAPLDVVEHFFTPSESDLLRALCEPQRTKTFFALWTLKEAYMKATARGMDLPLDSFAFDLNPIRLLFSTDDDDWARWKFFQIPIGSDHIASLAVHWPEATHLPVCPRQEDLNRLATLAEPI